MNKQLPLALRATAFVLGYFLIPTTSAQTRIIFAQGFHTNVGALGAEFDLPLVNFQGRFLAAPLPSNRQKYSAGPVLVLAEQPELGTDIYTAQHLSLDRTPFNEDWGTYHAIGGRFAFKRIAIFYEWALLWDVEPGFTGPISTGSLLGMSVAL